MQHASERFSPARGAAIFAAVLWGIAGIAAVSMARGNPTAINAVIGCSIPGVFAAFAAWGLHRQDRRHAENLRALHARLGRE